MSSEQIANGINPLDSNLGGAWDILKGYSGRDTDLGIARRFGGAAAAYSLRDIGAMNGRVVKVRRMQDDAVEDFSALQVASGSIEKFAIGQDVLDLYNNAAYFPTDSDYFSLGSGITLSGAFTISYDVVFTGSFGTNTSRIFQDDAGNDLLTFTASNVCKFRVGTTVRTMPALSTALQLGRKYSMIFARDGSGVYTLTVDGSVVSTTSATDTDDFLIQRIGFRNRGSISNININSGQHIYAGDGAENSNWTDTGSGTTTNATKVGTPVLFTGQGIDAFVDTWYDQSGNGLDMAQTTAADQPHIVENGGICKDPSGNNSTVKFVNVGTNLGSTFMTATPISGGQNPFTHLLVASSTNTGASGQTFVGCADGVDLRLSTLAMRMRSGNTNRTTSDNTLTSNTNSLLTYIRASGRVPKMALNNNALEVELSTPIAGVDNLNEIMGENSTSSSTDSFGLVGTISESILYTSDKDAESELSNLKADIDNHYNIL